MEENTLYKYARVPGITPLLQTIRKGIKFGTKPVSNLVAPPRTNGYTTKIDRTGYDNPARFLSNTPGSQKELRRMLRPMPSYIGVLQRHPVTRMFAPTLPRTWGRAAMWGGLGAGQGLLLTG